MKRYTKWIATAAVVMMLAAMFAYVLSDDETFPTAPMTEGQQPMPSMEQPAE